MNPDSAPPRGSSSLRVSTGVESVADHILMKLVGLTTFGGGGFFEYQEVTNDKKILHVLIFLAVCAAGCAMMFGKTFLDRMAGLLSIVSPWLPQRKSDTTPPSAGA